MRSKKTTQNSDYIPLEDIELDNNDDVITINNENDNSDTISLIPNRNSNSGSSDDENSDTEKIGIIISKSEDIPANNADEATISIPSTSQPITTTNTNNLSPHVANKKQITNSEKSGNKHAKNSSISKIHHIDGVFANLNEKPEVHSESLPTYYEVTGERGADPLCGYVVSVSQSEEFYGELVVNGLPLGSLPGMLFSTMISMAFDVLGFIMTFFLSASHASKKGSLIGLAVTIFRYGLYMNEQFDELENSDNSGNTGNSGNKGGYDPEDDEFDYIGFTGLMDQWWFGRWFAYFIMLVAAFIVYRNIYTYIRIKKAINYAKTHSECVTEG